MSEPKITVGIPVYNVEKYLVQCILSVIHQEYQNLEILIVEDKSTDQSKYVAEELARKDGRIRIVCHEKNRSLAGARNTILKEMQGDMVYWLDSDDYLLPNAISSCYQAMCDFDADVVKTIIRADDRSCVGEYTRAEYMKILIPDIVRSHMGGCLMKRHCFEGVSFKEGINMEDYEEFPKICENSERIKVIDNGTYCYRTNRAGNISNSSIRKFKGYELRAYRTEERYEKYKKEYPEECKTVLKQFVDYVCMANLMAEKEDNILPVRALMLKQERAVMINDKVSRYKKWLYRHVINNSSQINYARALHKLKQSIVYR